MSLLRKVLIPLFAFVLASAATGETGIASFYTVKSNGGTHTASGIPFNENAMTAAHKKLKMGTVVRVTRLDTKKSIVVKITDRGPYIKGRIIDLSKGAFAKLAPLDKGLFKCRVEVIKSP